MVGFRGVELQGEVGAKYFVLRNGQKTKTFYDAGKFYYRSGQFPIYDENKNVVEYMDLMGTFTKGETHVAISLYYYILSEYYLPSQLTYMLGVLNIPSRHFMNPKVKEFILEEEKARNKLMSTYNISLIERLRYRHVVNSCLKEKLKKAKKLAKQREIELKQEQDKLSV